MPSSVIVRSVFCLIAAAFAVAAASEETRQARVVNIAIGPLLPPLLHMGEDGSLTGYVPELLSEVARRAGIEFSYELIPDRAALRALNPRTHPLTAWLENDNPRPGYVSFDRSFFTLHAGVFRRHTSLFAREVEATELGEIIVVEFSEFEDDLFDGGGVRKLYTADNAADAMAQLAAGKHDTVIVGDYVGFQALKDLRINSISQVPSPEMHMHHHVDLHRAPDNPEIEALLSPAIQSVRTDGTSDALHAKWFGPLEPRKVSLRVVGIILATLGGAVFGLGLFVLVSRRHMVGVLKRQRTALHETESRLGELLGNVEAILWESTIDGRFTYVNQHAEELLGYPLSRWYERAFFPDVLLHPDDRERVVRDCAAASARGEDHVLDYRVRSASGKTFWLHDVVHVVKDAAGMPVKCHGVMVDTTARKLAEEALEAGRARLAAIMEASSTGIVRLDLDATVTFGNHEASRITGIVGGPNDLSTWLSAVHPDDRAGVAEAWKSVAKNGFSDYREYRFLRPDGEVVWVLDRGHPERDESGKFTGYVSTLTDITQRKRDEELLHTHSQVLMDLFEGVVTTSETGIILSANKSFYAMFGYGPGELVGKHVSILSDSSPDRTNEVYQGVMRTLHEKGSWTGEFNNRKKDGTPMLSRARISRVYGGGETYCVCVQEDITESRRAQEALRESEERFRRVAESSLVGITVFDGERFTFVNKAMMEMNGYSDRAELQGMSRDELAGLFFGGADRDRILAALEQLDHQSDSDVSVVLEDICMRHKDGTTRWASMMFSRLYPDRPFPRLTMCVETTTQQRATEALRKSEAMLRRTQRLARVGGWEIQFDSKSGGWSDQIHYINEISGDHPLSLETGLSFFSPDDRAQLSTSARKAVNEGTHWHFEGELTTAKGRKIWVKSTGEPVWENGIVVGLAGAIQDISEVKRAEGSLRESEEKFRRLAENAPIGIAIFDGTRYSYVNGAASRLLGYDPAEMQALDELTRAQLFVNRKDRQRVLMAIKALDARSTSSEPVEVEDVEMRSKDGSPRWVSLMFSRLFPDRPFPRVALGVDTTDRRRAEAATRESEERFRQVAESAFVGIAIFDGERYTYVNDAIISMIGYPRESFNGYDRAKQLTSLFRPTDADRIAKALAQFDAADGLSPIHIDEILLRRQDGQERCLSIFLSTLYPGKRYPTLLVTLDVTERRRAELALREREEMLRRTQHQAKVGGWVYDIAAHTMTCSDEMRRIYDLPDDDTPTGETLLACYLPQYAGMIRELGQRAAADGIPFEFEAELITRTGRLIWVQSSVEPIVENGRVVRLLGAVQDITERKRAEVERHEIEMRMQQSQKLESLGVLAGGIAHDFNNLLAGILGHAELAKAELDPESGPYESVAQIDAGARRAAELVHQMLAYSGKGKFVIRSVNVGRLVREMAQLLRVTLSKNALLRFEIDDDAPPIEADVAQIQQVVMNLITNASDAMGDDPGMITLRVSAAKYTEQELLAFVPHQPPEPGMFVSLEVTDTGCGMDLATQQKIFEPFFTTKFTGRGLGLAAVLGIVRSHDGGLRVTSKPGRGTAFHLLFPAVKHSADRSPATDGIASNGQGANGANGANGAGENGHSRAVPRSGEILVVDDEPRVRDYLVRALERFGHRVITAADGIDALDVFERRKETIDAVLLDITMPNMSGEEVLTALHLRWPELPVALMSGYSESEMRDRLPKNAVAAFLQKPFSIEALRDCVDAMFAKR